jgi:hypothetical protein
MERKMDFLKNLFQRLPLIDAGNKQRQSFVPPDTIKARPNRQQAVQANSKSGELTQDQLAEALHWLSLY